MERNPVVTPRELLEYERTLSPEDFEKPLEAFRNDSAFNPKAELNADEVSFFRACNAAHIKANLVFAKLRLEQINKGILTYEVEHPLSRARADILGREAGDALFANAIALAPWVFFTNQLERVAKELEITDAVSAEDIASIRHCFAIQHYPSAPMAVNALNWSRGTMQHPLLVAESAAGRTTVVEMIAHRITHGSLTPKASKLAAQVLGDLTPSFTRYDEIITCLSGADRQNDMTERMKKELAPLPGRAQQSAAYPAANMMLLAWSRDTLRHDTPAFHSKKEIERFTNILGQGMSRLAINGDSQTMEPYIIGNAIDQLTKRIVKQDDILLKEERAANDAKALAEHKRQAAIKAEESRLFRAARQEDERRTNAARALLEGQQRAANERLQYETFMATHQPYPLEQDRAAEPILHLFSKIGGSTAANASNAALSLSILSDIAHTLDTRKRGVKELGGLLLSSTSVSATATAFGLEKQIPSARSRTNAEVNAACKQLRTLATAPDVSETIESLMRSDHGVLLLALLTRDANRCRNYASILAASEKKTAPYKATIARLEAELTDALDGLSPEDTHALRNDPDMPEVKALNAAKAELAKEQIKLDAEHEKLVDEIRLVVSGTHAKRVEANHGDASIEKAPVSSGPPEEWKVDADTLRDFQFHPKPGDEQWLIVSHNEFPDKSFTLKTKATKKQFDSELKKLTTECEVFRANLTLLSELQRDAGFELTTSQGTAVQTLSLVHPEYGIKIVLDGNDSAIAGQLVAAQQHYDAIALQQHSMIRSLEEHGITVKHAPGGPLTLQRTDAPPEVISTRGYFSATDFETVQQLLDNVQNPSPHTLPEPERESPREAAPDGLWHPAPGKTMMIFDANVLSKLSAHRGGAGRSWLDLLECTSRLPNVTVIIPEVIAEWEMRGRIPLYDEHHTRTGFMQVDPRFADVTHNLHHFSKATKAALKGASRAHINADGTVSFEQGKIPNLIIMGTDGDREFYDRLRTIGQSGNTMNRLIDSIHDTNEGEHAINRIIAQCPHPMPAMIVTDDLRYLNDKDLAPSKTGRNQPVHYAGSGAYVTAEIDHPGRARELRSQLGEEYSLSLHRISGFVGDMYEKMGKEKPDLFAHASINRNRSGKTSTSHIRELLAQGIEQSRSAPLQPAPAPIAAAPAPQVSTASVHGRIQPGNENQVG